ncbi:hypothetical protein M2105_005438 [Paenibacillus sp. PastF-1]|nr:hypothetical protein [Paenibacillus sp. PastF-2]MDF9850971.1 hypothetical protein [Paenibacillus sp. PastM-2]MDF9857542.1 hypothetical protein [Paenibacillus sp. PastF-1]MDH6482817.1 hypothetical protein [Paenibacillus sp. PastH-2]MDH6510242.1 hypothetical protein [Paenibacillus sp. PastM-3]
MKLLGKVLAFLFIIILSGAVLYYSTMLAG